MKAIFPFKIIVVLLISFSLLNCSKEEIIPGDVEINNFVWGGMNAFYKYQGEIEDLADTNFSTRDQLNEYLSDFETPDVLFESLLFTSEDELSFITDDFTLIEDALAGIKLTTGMKVNGIYYKDSNDFYVYVYDVIEGSSADIEGVTRGMLITEVNGVVVTLNNIETLFESDNINITLADYNDGNPVSNGTVINLIKTDVQENPIKTASLVGNGIGYIMYNNFNPNYDGELNSFFAAFRAEGITDLIVDLRYNIGGAIESANYLASMITGQFEGEVFSKQIWNDKVMSNVLNENLTNVFTDEIDNGIINQTISSLGLETVYFIVSDATAGPAEVLINGLKDNINVVLIGSQTKGLIEGSLTIYDSDDYTKSGDNFNDSHTWALQPIVLEVQNNLNINQPIGHMVNVELLEDSGNLGVLGDVTSEPLLIAAIEQITSGSATLNEEANVTTQNLWNSSMLFFDFDKMYVSLAE